MRNCNRGHNKRIKQYSTLEMLCTYTDDNGNALSLAGITIKADMKTDSYLLVDSLSISILDSDAGKFLMTPSINKLPAGVLNIDIIFIKDGKMLTSETYSIDVEVAITDPSGV